MLAPLEALLCLKRGVSDLPPAIHTVVFFESGEEPEGGGTFYSVFPYCTVPYSLIFFFYA